MTKKELREIMLEVIHSCDDEDRDEWYSTERNFTEYGIKKLAERLRIDL